MAFPPVDPQGFGAPPPPPRDYRFDNFLDHVFVVAVILTAIVFILLGGYSLYLSRDHNPNRVTHTTYGEL